MSNRCRIDAKSTPEEERARRTRGWGPGGPVPNKPLTTQAVPVFGSGGSSAKRVFLYFSTVLTLTEKDGSGFGSWKTVPAVPVPLSVSGKTVPTVPVSGSGFRFLSHPAEISFGSHNVASK